MENYAKNGRENNKFIEDDVNMKRQNKGKWMERWIVTLRLRVVGDKKVREEKMKRQNKKRWKVILKLRGSGEMKR